MRNFSKIMMILLVLALCISAMAISAFAEVEDPAAEIYADAECAELVESYASIEDALTAAEAGQYVIIKKTAENFTTAKAVADGIFVKAAEGVTFTVSNDTALALNEAGENGYDLTALKEGCACDIMECIQTANSFEQPVIFLGDGVPVFEALIREHAAVPVYFAPAHRRLQSAASVGALAVKYAAEGRFVDAKDHAPDYFRMSQAERERMEAANKAE